MEDSTNVSKDNTRKISTIILVVFVLLITSYYSLSAPITSKDLIIHIPKGESINFVSKELKDKKSIRNEFFLKLFIKLFKSNKGIISGDYLIENKTPVFVVAWQISRGKHKISPIKVTIQEGLTNEKIANILADKLSGFRKDLFLSEAIDKQGYLFPDTYFFFPLDESSEIIDKLSDNFNLKIDKISSEIKSSSKNLEDIIIMASVLEGEANNDDAEVISGILWKRLSLGMPLQVDVDKSTYNKKGLPSYPLNNPGIKMIMASINPTQSSYLYYLHDKDGNVHYAMSYEEHKKNINKYLK